MSVSDVTPSSVHAPKLNRRTCSSASAAAPIRIVHLGLGAFHRAHQAWYTAHASDAAEWGIAAFTGRSPEAADRLVPQDGLYTLIERAADGDTAEIVSSVVEARDGSDVARLRALIAAPEVAIVTLTVTETAYRLTPDGAPNTEDSAVLADISALRDAEAATAVEPTTVLGRLLSGLRARRAAGAGPIAVVPCDNIPNNGDLVHTGLRQLAQAVDAALASWVEQNVSFVSTSVDRITPRSTPSDREAAQRLAGYDDASPVVTEPFSDWVLSGSFPAGRPDWAAAGARFVDDIAPFERRKLWLLNGAHSLLAYAGTLRGHATVAEAMSDTVCREWVRQLWDEDARHLPATLDLTEYRTSLEERFDNARIAHHLAQIGMEGATKLGVRITPILRAERVAGRKGTAAVRALAAWIALLQGGHSFADAEQERIDDALHSGDPVASLIRLVDPALLDHDSTDGDALVRDVHAAIAALQSARETAPGRD